MLSPEYENNLTRMSLNLLVALANIPYAVPGEVIHLWNGKFTFFYHQMPRGTKHVHYTETCNYYDTEAEAKIGMSQFCQEYMG